MLLLPLPCSGSVCTCQRTHRSNVVAPSSAEEARMEPLWSSVRSLRAPYSSRQWPLGPRDDLGHVREPDSRPHPRMGFSGPSKPLVDPSGSELVPTNAPVEQPVTRTCGSMTILICAGDDAIRFTRCTSLPGNTDPRAAAFQQFEARLAADEVSHPRATNRSFWPSIAGSTPAGLSRCS